MPQGHPDPRHQLRHPKRLGEVVVRAHVEDSDLGGFLLARTGQ
jgi:hypothetical protein